MKTACGSTSVLQYKLFPAGRLVMREVWGERPRGVGQSLKCAAISSRKFSRKYGMIAVACSACRASSPDVTKVQCTGRCCTFSDTSLTFAAFFSTVFCLTAATRTVASNEVENKVSVFCTLKLRSITSK